MNYYQEIMDTLNSLKEDEFNQNVYLGRDLEEQVDVSNCGCLLHYLVKGDIINLVERGSMHKRFGLSITEHAYIFGTDTSIKAAARGKGYPEPTGFGIKDAIERVNYIHKLTS